MWSVSKHLMAEGFRWRSEANGDPALNPIFVSMDDVRFSRDTKVVTPGT